MLFSVQTPELMLQDSAGGAISNANPPHTSQGAAAPLAAAMLQSGTVAQSLSPSSSIAASLSNLQPSASTSTGAHDVHAPSAGYAHAFESTGAPGLPDVLHTLLPRKKGKGGRQPAMDPRLDPRIDAKKAKRIMANRQSAARSKMKQKLLMDGLRTQHTLLAYQKDAVARELTSLNGRCLQLEEDNLSIITRIQALTDQYRIQHVLTTKLSEQRDRLAAATGNTPRQHPTPSSTPLHAFNLPATLQHTLALSMPTSLQQPPALQQPALLPGLMQPAIKTEQQDFDMLGALMPPFSKPLENKLGGMAAMQGTVQQQQQPAAAGLASNWPTCLLPLPASSLGLNNTSQVALRCA